LQPMTGIAIHTEPFHVAIKIVRGLKKRER
jgi:hypothetical protein